MNKKCMMLLIILISFFGVNLRVDAAQELTCLYEKGNSSKVLLLQDSNGKLYVFKNNGDKGLDNLEWWKSKAVPRWATDSFLGVNWDTGNDPKIKEGELTDCPEAVKTLYDGGLRFYNAERYDRQSIETSKTTFHKPAAVYENFMYDVHNGITCDNIENKWITPFVEGGEYVSSCLYYSDYYTSAYSSEAAGCSVVQLSADKDKNLYLDVSIPEGPETDKGIAFDNINVTVLSFERDYLGSCPAGILVQRDSDSYASEAGNSYEEVTVNVSFGQSKDGYKKYVRAECAGVNSIYPERSLCGINSGIGFIKTDKFKSCDELFGSSRNLLKIVKTLVNLFKIFIPMLLVGLGALDFVKAMFSGNEDGMKKAQTKFVKRVIIALVIFLIPTMLRFVLEISKTIWPNIDATLCGII